MASITDPTETPMTRTAIDLAERSHERDGDHVLRAVSEAALPLFPEAAVQGPIGVDKHGRVDQAGPRAMTIGKLHPTAAAARRR